MGRVTIRQNSTGKGSKPQTLPSTRQVKAASEATEVCEFHFQRRCHGRECDQRTCSPNSFLSQVDKSTAQTSDVSVARGCSKNAQI